jgi:hypothetical protein
VFLTNLSEKGEITQNLKYDDLYVLPEYIKVVKAVQ